MNIDDYFDKPVLDSYRGETMRRSYTFGANLSEGAYKVALIGLPADSDDYNAGCCKAPDEVRRHLYALKALRETSVVDLGNLKCGGSYADTHYALRDVVSELIERGVTTVVIGGSHDYTSAIYEALADEKDEVTLSVIDSRIDFENADDDSALSGIGPRNFLRHIFKSDKLYDFNLLATQFYLCSDEQLYEIGNRGFNNVRLSSLRESLANIEPILRDSDVVSMDISCVRHSDAPGQESPSPNGLFGEEICSLARYAGLSDRTRVFGLFDVNPYYDNNGQTSNLAAEAIWHFVEAYSFRYGDYPFSELSNYKKIVVPESDGSDKVFYYNRLNKRLWIEVPTLRGRRVFACSSADFQKVKAGELPDVWLRHFLR